MFSCQTISLDQIIDIHPLSLKTSKKLALLQHQNAINDIETEQLKSFLTIYPIHLVAKQSFEDQFYVVAGIRQYEILRSAFTAKKQKISDTPFRLDCIVHTSLSTKSLERMVLNDLIGGAIVFSLGKKPESQLDMLQEHYPDVVTTYLPRRKQSRAWKEKNDGISE